MNYLIFLIFLVLFFSVILVVALKNTKKTCLEKRFEDFSISTNDDIKSSMVGNIFEMLWKFISFLGTILNKSKVFTDISKKYEKHISYRERLIRKPIDYVALKLFLSLLFLIIYLICVLIKVTNFILFMALIIVLIGYFIPDIFLNIKFRAKKKRIQEDLLKAVIVMNNSFKAGRNIYQAIEVVISELDGPIKDEFSKIYTDISYGLSLEIAFKRFYECVLLEDASYITSSLSLLNKTGGNIVKVFQSIEKSLYGRKEIYNELKSMTSSSSLVFKILVLLPFLFALSIYILDPNYFKPFFESLLGLVLFIIMILILIIYIITIRKFMKVDTYE